MTIETLNAIMNAFNAASDDATRFNLNHVRVTAKGDTVRIEATDGRVLSDVSLPDAEFAALVGDTVYAAARETLPLLKMLAKTWKHGVPQAPVEGGIRLGEPTVSSISLTLRSARAQGIEFPDFAAVWPKESPDAIKIAFNVEYLDALVKAMRQDKRNNTAELIIIGSTDPIRVKVGEATGLLMPVRLGKSVSYIQAVKESA